MRNKDNIKFIITLFLFLLPIFSEELKKYPSLAWASAGLGSIVALMTNARGVFLVRNLVNLIFPEYSISFERTITQDELNSLIRKTKSESVDQKLPSFLENEIKNISVTRRSSSETPKIDQKLPDDFEDEIKSVCSDLEKGLLAYSASKRSSGK